MEVYGFGLEVKDSIYYGSTDYSYVALYKIVGWGSRNFLGFTSVQKRPRKYRIYREMQSIFEPKWSPKYISYVCDTIHSISISYYTCLFLSYFSRSSPFQHHTGTLWAFTPPATPHSWRFLLAWPTTRETMATSQLLVAVAKRMWWKAIIVTGGGGGFSSPKITGIFMMWPP